MLRTTNDRAEALPLLLGPCSSSLEPPGTGGPQRRGSRPFRAFRAGEPGLDRSVVRRASAAAWSQEEDRCQQQS
jgi:hypothetical protein